MRPLGRVPPHRFVADLDYVYERVARSRYARCSAFERGEVRTMIPTEMMVPVERGRYAKVHRSVTVACPRCRAKPGELCEGAYERAIYTHVERKAVWRKREF